MKEDLIKNAKTAIQNNDLEYLKVIIEENKEILDVISPFGTILQIAAREGNIDIVKHLIDCKCNINLGGGLFKKSPLSDAAFKGHLDIVELLVKNGARLDVSSFENNPLFAAIYNRHIDIAKYLIDQGIDTKTGYPLGDIEYCDASEYARQYGVTEIVDSLMKKNSEEQV